MVIRIFCVKEVIFLSTRRYSYVHKKQVLQLLSKVKPVNLLDFSEIFNEIVSIFGNFQGDIFHFHGNLQKIRVVRHNWRHKFTKTKNLFGRIRCISQKLHILSEKKLSFWKKKLSFWSKKNPHLSEKKFSFRLKTYCNFEWKKLSFWVKKNWTNIFPCLLTFD